MKSYHGSTTENLKCEICGNSTGGYIEYRYTTGLSIRMPICNECTETRSQDFYKNMKRYMRRRLVQIRRDIQDEKEFSFIYEKGHVDSVD